VIGRENTPGWLALPQGSSYVRFPKAGAVWGLGVSTGHQPLISRFRSSPAMLVSPSSGGRASRQHEEIVERVPRALERGGYCHAASLAKIGGKKCDASGASFLFHCSNFSDPSENSSSSFDWISCQPPSAAERQRLRLRFSRGAYKAGSNPIQRTGTGRTSTRNRIIRPSAMNPSTQPVKTGRKRAIGRASSSFRLERMTRLRATVG
jgi:hypothetical protein